MHNRNKKQKRKGPRKGSKRGGGGVTSVNPSRTPWPTRQLTQIKYTDEFDISLTTGVLSNYIFNSNGLYDPDQTGTGHQPLGFDQFAAMYNRYRVLKTDYHVVFGNVGTTAAAVRCSVAHLNGSTVPARPAIFELANSKQGVVGPYGQPLSKRGRFDLTRLNADPPKYRIDDRYSASIGSNPVEVMYIILSLYPNVNSTCRVSVSFTYHVEFYDIETPGSSIASGGHSVEFYRQQFRESKALSKAKLLLEQEDKEKQERDHLVKKDK